MYSLSSNTGELMLFSSLVWLMPLVLKTIRDLDELESFLAEDNQLVSQATVEGRVSILDLKARKEKKRREQSGDGTTMNGGGEVGLSGMASEGGGNRVRSRSDIVERGEKTDIL